MDAQLHSLYQSILREQVMTAALAILMITAMSQVPQADYTLKEERHYGYKIEAVNEWICLPKVDTYVLRGDLEFVDFTCGRRK